MSDTLLDAIMAAISTIIALLSTKKKKRKVEPLP